MSTEPATLRIERVVYGGYGLARQADTNATAAFVPSTLPGELVRATPPAGATQDWQLLEVIEPSSSRTAPGCPHFGACGGCQLQMATYAEQLRIKREVLLETLERAALANLPEITTHSAEPWGYRNRIRLHVTRDGESLRFGYRKRNSRDILPISTCPIAAPLLWRAAEAILSHATGDTALEAWLRSTSEVELFCNADETKLQVNLIFTARASAMKTNSFERTMSSLHKDIPELSGAGAVVVNARSGRVIEQLAAWGAGGLSYSVSFAGKEERYWIERGGFFQVNRFLTTQLTSLVCADRAGALAWDLFAGVGLFARILAHTFDQVVAVEANPTAARELNTTLRKLGPHLGIEATTLEFLRARVLQRERPDLIVLDPPRAGAGEDVCTLLAQLAPREIVYVSCDPTTLARDLAQLQRADYHSAALHLIDLFPQTYHQETIVVLRRDA
jgi:23S rRNA (uracil1939-C5)-methyltransferase